MPQDPVVDIRDVIGPQVVENTGLCVGGPLDGKTMSYFETTRLVPYMVNMDTTNTVRGAYYTFDGVQWNWVIRTP